MQLRESFDARGTVRHDGSLRQWTNGNLQVLLEPTASGHRIRMRTVKREAGSLMRAGLGLVAVGVSALVSAVVGGDGGIAAGARGAGREIATR